MKINMAHLRERSVSGEWINFAVFEADSKNGNRIAALSDLTNKARMAGLKIDQSALAYMSGGKLTFFGDKNLVSFLSKNWYPIWTHKLTV